MLLLVLKDFISVFIALNNSVEQKAKHAVSWIINNAWELPSVFVFLTVCAVRVIGESDLMQDFLAAGELDDVRKFFYITNLIIWVINDRSLKGCDFFLLFERLMCFQTGF